MNIGANLFKRLLSRRAEFHKYQIWVQTPYVKYVIILKIRKNTDIFVFLQNISKKYCSSKNKYTYCADFYTIEKSKDSQLKVI